MAFFQFMIEQGLKQLKLKINNRKKANKRKHAQNIRCIKYFKT